MRYGMAIDLKRCIGCHSCSVACKSNNNLPNKIWWNRVLTVGGEGIDCASGTYPNAQIAHLPINCQHCENPPCVAACPTGASYKREEDGIVLVDYDQCIGCRLCMVACPYNARSFNWQEPEYYVDHAVGDADAPVHQFNTVEKCTFCVNRLARGEEPACMELCLGRARTWGDLDDPESEVSKAIQGRQTVRLLEDKGTGPAVFYLK
jgi:molybdopterin-containing oxidoreductase family iron-sulfur binding subunit